MLCSLVVLMTAGCTVADPYLPANQLNEKEQAEFKYAIVRFAGYFPKGANQGSKLEGRFDSAYRAQANLLQLDKYFINEKDGYIYFELSRIAPSFKKKYVATGGRLKRDAAGIVKEYEEIYRTWKMERPQLQQKTRLFFAAMVAGEDLSPYYTDNIGDMEHIEFPDRNTYYDKENRKWETLPPKQQ